jgi:hypothetical protein
MKIINLTSDDHEHCWHFYHGAIHMVIPDGHVVRQCCKCQAIRAVHADHALDQHERGRKWK